MFFDNWAAVEVAIHKQRRQGEWGRVSTPRPLTTFLAISA
jgi:adenosyl cobinamide kinase/adenosyl cobinamide phosphate guanylyltransferase